MIATPANQANAMNRRNTDKRLFIVLLIAECEAQIVLHLARMVHLMPACHGIAACPQRSQVSRRAGGRNGNLRYTFHNGTCNARKALECPCSTPLLILDRLANYQDSVKHALPDSFPALIPRPRMG